MEPEGSLPHSQEPATCPYPNQKNAVFQKLKPKCKVYYSCFVYHNFTL
jgi:hypothetical protein